MTWPTGALRALAALTAVFLFALPASAQTYDPLTADDVAQLLKSQGYEATIDPRKDDDGEYVNSKADNIGFWIHFDDCDSEGKNCKAIVFDAGFSFNTASARPDLKRINGWNEYNLGKAGLDGEDNPWINIEVNLVGGVTRANLVETLAQWKSMLKDFTGYINWK